jgi:hypothetical protein
VTRLLREVFAEASRLGLRPWERLVLILAAALFLVMGKRVGEVVAAAIRNAKLEPAPEPADENGPQPPGVTFPADPDPDRSEPGRGSG